MADIVRGGRAALGRLCCDGDGLALLLRRAFGRSRRSRSQSRTGDCRVIERGSIEKRCPSYGDLKFELVFGAVD